MWETNLVGQQPLCYNNIVLLRYKKYRIIISYEYSKNNIFKCDLDKVKHNDNTLADKI